MTSLLDGTPEARAWVDAAMARYGRPRYAQVASAVVWSDERSASGALRVEADPIALVASIRLDPLMMFANHDPGRPVGQVLDVQAFQSPDGHAFVAAVIGYYAREGVRAFSELAGDAKAVSVMPTSPENLHIEMMTDPRDFPDGWIEEVTSEAPVPVQLTTMSYNAAETDQELIRIGLYLGALLFNPFTKAIATEAGKDAYGAIHGWLKSTLDRSRTLKAPVVVMDTTYGECQVSFLIRGKRAEAHYRAHEQLSAATAEAMGVVDCLEARGTASARLVYEFDMDDLRWFPSYAVLTNGVVMAHSPMLIALAHELPDGLSLGMRQVDMGPP